jgi:anti-anti-sigma regulatory factor
MMATVLSLDITRGSDGKPALVAAGEIDLSNIDAFSRALTAATAEAASSGEILTVDFSALEYLDSGAINALVAHADHIKLVAHPLLMSALTVSGLTELVTVEAAAPTAEH